MNILFKQNNENIESIESIEDIENIEAPPENDIDKLFCGTNNDNILLLSEAGEEIELEQIAVIPYRGIYYAILKPVIPIPGMSEDEALVFSIDDFANKLRIVDNMDIIDAVFEIYDEAYDEAYGDDA